jgi:hypothetical protein
LTPDTSPIVDEFYYVEEEGVYSNFANGLKAYNGDCIQWNGTSWELGSNKLDYVINRYVTYNEAVFEKFKSSVQAQQRFVNEDDVAKTGFKGFLVNGVEFYLDAFAFGSRDNSTKDNWAVIFPVDVIKFYYNYGFDNPSPFDTSKDGLQLPLQPIKSIQKYMTGNIVCTNRRLVAVNKTLVA